MSQETREEFKDVKQEYMDLKNEIKAEINRREGVAKVEDALMISGADDDLKEVTADNLLSVYRSFVNTVDKYKDDYSAQQWARVEAYWDMLNNRKNEVEDDLPDGDNTEIAKLKLEYGGYKVVYKTGAKMESKDTENK